MSSLITRQPAFSSVNCGSNEKPSLVKKSIDLPRSFTGRLTKIFVDMARLFPLVGSGLAGRSRPQPAEQRPGLRPAAPRHQGECDEQEGRCRSEEHTSELQSRRDL